MKNKVISLSSDADIVNYFTKIRSNEVRFVIEEQDVYTIGEVLETLELNNGDEELTIKLNQLKEAYALYNRESFTNYTYDVLRQIYEIVRLCNREDNNPLKRSLIDIANTIINVYLE